MSIAKVTKSIYDRMANSSALVSRLSTYEGEPAIFTYTHVPSDAEFPCVVSVGAVTNEPLESKTTIGFELTRDFTVYTNATGDTEEVESICDLVRSLFHRHKLEGDNFKTVVADASAPIISPTDERVYGMMFTLRLVIERTDVFLLGEVSCHTELNGELEE